MTSAGEALLLSIKVEKYFKSRTKLNDSMGNQEIKSAMSKIQSEDFDVA